MTVRIYVGNLPFKTVDSELENLFNSYGDVQAANVIRYKKSGRSKGYGFVVMPRDHSEQAVEKLNGCDFEGRILKVNIAKERKNFPNSKGSMEMRGLRYSID